MTVLKGRWPADNLHRFYSEAQLVNEKVRVMQ